VDCPLDDPKGQDVETVRRIIDEIDGRVRVVIAEIAPDTRPPAG